MKKLSVADIGSSIRAHQNAGSDILRSLFDTFIRPEKEVPKPKMKASLQHKTTPISKRRRGRDLPEVVALRIAGRNLFAGK